MSTEITTTQSAVATDAVVVATDVSKIYGEGDSEVRALDGVSVSFPKGQLAAVMGPSGSGKSTLMHILAGLDQPTSGSVLVDGTELDQWKAAVRPNTKAFFIESPTNPTLEIIDIEAVAAIAHDAGARLRPTGRQNPA